MPFSGNIYIDTSGSNIDAKVPQYILNWLSETDGTLDQSVSRGDISLNVQNASTLKTKILQSNADASFSDIDVSGVIQLNGSSGIAGALLTSNGTKFANRSMGFLFGAVKGMIILMLLYWTVDLFPEKKWAAIIREESYLSKTFSNTRHIIIDIFHLTDPVRQGEIFIQNVIKRDSGAGKKET